MKIPTPLLLVLLPLLGLSQCIGLNEEPAPALPMPAATQTGANTAGCRVDGQLWVAERTYLLFGPQGPPVTAKWDNASTGGPHLLLYFEKQLSDEARLHYDTDLTLKIPGITGPGTFALDRTPNPNLWLGNVPHAVFTFNKPSPRRTHLTGPQTPGRLVVTRLDTVARIVSGTFEFTAAEGTSGLTGNGTPVPGGKTVRVTDGRFDCKF